MFSVIPEQDAIYNSKSKRILINAAPGTGKSVVTVCSAVKFVNMFLNKSSTTQYSQVLVVSLTNNAADNVEQKAIKLLKDSSFIRHFNLKHGSDAILSRIVFSTLHSFSLTMLVQFNRINPSTKMSIVDNEYNKILLNKILSNVKPAWEDDKSIQKDLLKINLKGISNKKLKKFLNKKFPQYHSDIKLISKILTKLNQLKCEANVITFDDMVLLFNKLLQKKRIREEVHKLFPVILIDEFQDLSGLHWRLLKKLIGKKSYLFCSGDDGQVVYSWNGASFKRFQHFKKRYSQCKIFCLTENLRSTQRLSDVSSGLMAQSRYATKKNLAAKKKGVKPKVILNSNPIENCDYVIKKIKNLRRTGLSYKDITGVYRHHADGFELRQRLLHFKIPFKVYRDKSKRDRPIVRLIFSLIKIIESDKIIDDDWNEVLMEIKGVGKKYVPKIISWLRNKNPKEVLFPHDYKFTPFVEQLLLAINRFCEPHLSNTKKLEMIFNFALTLPNVNRSIEHHIKPTLYKLASKGKLSDIILKYQDLSYPLYYPIKEDPPYSDSYITLSTVHGVKGGEFDTVFYLGSNNFFYNKYKLFKGSKKRENELQVMNVAVTRPTRMLYLLFPIDKKTWQQNTKTSNPFIFLNQLNRKLLNVK